ncbi:DUF4132 domain-containing protein [Pelomonas sp. BJYL3]|uniref:DUF4132 domain-containing protein n=1 Tax=Pelomonas sp. BJYL3 TaxID=2976697 RepID=UPI0022B5B6ED|nr:DUF4132 domain-containing protein [Pelomonas sp. BJYL3]
MLKWVATLLGNASFELPEGVPEVWVQRMEALLSPLDAAAPPKGRVGLARDMLEFVLHGSSAAVLGEVAASEFVAEHLHLSGYHYGHAKGVPDVYEHFNALPPAVGLRWAQLLAASTSSLTRMFSFQLPRGLRWPEALLQHSAGHSLTGWSGRRARARHLSAACLEALQLEDGIEASALLVSAFSTPLSSSYFAEQRLLLVTDLKGYAQMLDCHLLSVRPFLLAEAVPQRLHVLKLLETAEVSTLQKLLPQLSLLATASSKQVRAAAEPLLRRCGSAGVDALAALATGGKPDQRYQALALLFKLASEQEDGARMDWARQVAGADKAASVQALRAEWEESQAALDAGPERYDYVLPVIDWASDLHRLPGHVQVKFWHEVTEAITQANQQAREHHARMAAQGHKFQLRETEHYTAADQQALAQYLAAAVATPPRREEQRQRVWQHVTPALETLVESGALTPVSAMKMLAFFQVDTAPDGSLLMPARRVFERLYRRSGHPTLLEISVLLDQSGHMGRALLLDYCSSWNPFAADWAAADVWPFFAHHLDWLVEVLMNNPIKSYSFDRKGLYRALATLPSPPAVAVSALFGLAMGPTKTDRKPAQEALQHLPGKEQRIIEALGSGKAEVRMLAAQWLGRLRHEPAVPSLEQALRKEKNDLTKGALLDALQQLGQAVEKYLDREALATEAAKSLAKGLPKDLDWFPWSAMPRVRWADGQGQVPTEVLQWMLAQAVRQKLPEPNAVLRKYCGMFEARDREALGQFVLEAWLQEDVRPISPDEAMTLAKNSALSTQQSMTQFPQYYQEHPHWGKSVEEMTAAYLPACLRHPAGSATGSKGLLAVAAACAAERAAAPTQRYLKEWYGSRASQGKALIAMLAWIEHPSATQLMLAIGSRFRTRSFQEEATRQAQALAERKGWTLAELADRTIPSAGFDENGVLELSYGPRVFQARLLPDFKVELFNPDGKKIAALPEPRQDDDADTAKQSRKALSAAKKELKSIVDLQTDRLYEALCTQREWSYADWRAYLFEHPVARHLVQRLVWVQVEDGQAVQVFRPLDDGSLTDCEDEAVTLPDDACIRLAHDSLLDDEVVAGWQQHLVDYEVKPLFQQLGKGRYTLPAEQAQSDEILDFKGHMLEAFALRGRALKLGYTRGPAEDGGWFHVYEKRFPTLGLTATLEFTGNPLPEENRSVALIKLTFSATQSGDRWDASHLLLSKVPPVLLSECYNDLRLIAAEGAGFDPAWEKKSEY